MYLTFYSSKTAFENCLNNYVAKQVAFRFFHCYLVIVFKLMVRTSTASSGIHFSRV